MRVGTREKIMHWFLKTYETISYASNTADFKGVGDGEGMLVISSSVMQVMVQENLSCTCCHEIFLIYYKTRNLEYTVKL